MFYATNYLSLDCLHYRLVDSVPTEVVQYCLRPINNNLTFMEDFRNIRDQNYTFDELRKTNTTAHEILAWSASIDLAEHYQYYIDQQNHSFASNHIFFNCTPPWFGSRCQYSFKFDKTTSGSIAPGVVREDQRNDISTLSVTGFTCYTLLECDRGSAFLCLDWREVCDGRIDCLNDGVDEAQCFDLEMNECEDNEYRCHNGLCITKDIATDGYYRVQCLDQSDALNVPDCPNLNLEFDSFICEEYSCRPGQGKFSCGDGQCVEDFEECENGRHLMLAKSMSVQGNLSHHCWIAMACLTRIVDQVDGVLCEQLFKSADIMAHLLSCESLVQFPTVHVLFGHVRFLHRRKDMLNVNVELALTPDYICYDEQLCNHLIPTFRHESYICQHAHQMGIQSNVTHDNWKSIIDTIKPYFRGCIVGYNEKNLSEYLSLYLCKNSSKYISKHRILDGISDCYLNDDETDFQSSPAVIGQYRLTCANETQCRSSSFSSRTSPPIEQKNPSLNLILFHQICDRTLDLLPELIDGRNHTDETDCEYWQCSNIYTRCDGIWNCPKGEDEEGCVHSICPSDTRACISPHNNRLTCLPADQVGNGIIDCLGAYDEHQYCRIADFSNGITNRFRCLNDTTCLEMSRLCNSDSDCPLGDDERFCENRQGLCDESALYDRTDIQNILCRISTKKRVAFTLETAQTYPTSNNQVIETTFDYPMERYKDANSMESGSGDLTRLLRCNHGVSVYLWLGYGNYTSICFCPPNYYGNMCEYQNDRVSLILTVSTNKRRDVYAVMVSLIEDDNDQQEVHSYDQLMYVPRQSCRQPYNVYLLYSMRQKTSSKNYSIRIDVFNKLTLTYIASWQLKVPFPFLPVNRIVARLSVPLYSVLESSSCPITCQNGTCIQYVNQDKFFCRCNTGWSGVHCDIAVSCNDCSPGSVCVGAIHNRSICVCPIGRFGSRCLLKHSCPHNYCENNGQCIVIDERMIEASYVCFCSESFRGTRCEYSRAKLLISFDAKEVSSYLIAYIYPVVRSELPTHRHVILEKLTILQRSTTLYHDYGFAMVFIKTDRSYYLAVLQKVASLNSSTSLDSTRRCPSINELLNTKQLKLPRIQRVKYYHIPCKTDLSLKCFFDESYMCMCTVEHHANCFLFDHQANFSCPEHVHCQNGGQCLQDDPTCSFTTICVCTDCFFGDQCQFYAKGMGLTLDDILRYLVRPKINFSEQPQLIKVSAVFTMMLFLVGLLNSTLSLLVFHSRDAREVGCGIYLHVSSITSILTLAILVIKFWFAVLVQTNMSSDRTILRLGCLFIEPILKLCLNMGNWLHACVAIERSINVYKGIYFNKSVSKCIARWIVFVLPFFVIGSDIHESLYRDLFDDREEQRVWCVTVYSRVNHGISTAILLFHFLAPFCANLFSTLFIILSIARLKATARTRQSYRHHLQEQVHRHKQLIISPMILVILSSPRLIISLSSGCVKASRGSWLYLGGYLVSFIPSATIFIVFVLPSAAYKKILQESIKNCKRQFQLREKYYSCINFK